VNPSLTGRARPAAGLQKFIQHEEEHGCAG